MAGILLFPAFCTAPVSGGTDPSEEHGAARGLCLEIDILKQTLEFQCCWDNGVVPPGTVLPKKLQGPAEKPDPCRDPRSLFHPLLPGTSHSLLPFPAEQDSPEQPAGELGLPGLPSWRVSLPLSCSWHRDQLLEGLRSHRPSQEFRVFIHR